MFKLTPSELRVYEAMLGDPRRVWTTEQVAELIYGDVRPKSWRPSAISCMKALRMKTLPLDANRVVKVSKARGRGQVGKFTLKKNALRLGMAGE